MKKLLYLFVAVAVGFTACKEDDVIGVEHLAKYGNIKVQVEGERADGEDFSEEFTLKFVPGDNSLGYVSAVYYESDNEDAYFEIYRADGASEGSNYVGIELGVYDFAGNPEFDLDDTDISLGILTGDNKFFEIYSSNLYQYIDTDDIENFSFNPENGKLSFTMTGTISAEDGNNDTGNDIDVTITVDITVFEYIQQEGEGQQLEVK